MVELDIEYAENLGFWLDVTILLRTVPTVLLGRGAC
jgi:lipopolysaccharide/colanic/teichoic acid biosynthesis glycosyltransferase